MTRSCALFVVMTAYLVVLVGCQTPMTLWGNKGLDKKTSLADAAKDDEQTDSVAVEDLIDKADRAFHGQRYSEARVSYEQVLRQSPDHSHAHHHLAVIADLEERYSEAEEHYRAALLRDGRNSKILSSLAYSYILQGRLDDAEPRLHQARAADPADLNAASNLALLYACRGDREKCEAIARTLGPSDQTQTIVDDMFVRAGDVAPAPATQDSQIQLAGAFDIFKRDKQDDSDLPDGVNRETWELKQKMEQARLDARRARQARNANDPRRQIPPTSEILGVQGTPVDQLRDRLAEIDRQPSRTDNSVMADPRIADLERRQQRPAPQQPAPRLPSAVSGPPTSNPFADFTQQSPTGGVVTADLVEGPQGYGQSQPNRAVTPTQATDPRGTAAPWPAELDRSQNPQFPYGAQAQALPAPNNGAAQQQGNGGYGQPAPPMGRQSNGQPQLNAIPQQNPHGANAPAGQGGVEDARRRAAALGMGTGLGGMFDRYAYKQSQQAGSQQNVVSQQSADPGLFGYEQTPANEPTQFDVTTQSTTQQQWPGTNSMHGAMYPHVQRMLPTDRPSTPPAINAGMAPPPNWQGQTLPTSTAQLSGPGQYQTVTPNGAAAPAPPRSSFSQPYTAVQPLPSSDNLHSQHNNRFNQLQRQMMGSPNLTSSDPTSSNPMSLNSIGASGQSYGPTQTGPTNTNVPYYDRGTAPAAGGFDQIQRVGVPAANNNLPPGFVQPPPYRGGAATQTPIEPPTFNGTQAPQQQPFSQRPAPGTLPQISPGR